MIALSTLPAFLKGAERSITAPEAEINAGLPHQKSLSTPAGLPPLLSLAEMDQTTAALVRLLNGLGAQGETRTMASMYRQLAHWPGFLALAFTLLQPLHANGTLQVAVERAREHAMMLAQQTAGKLAAGGAPSPPAGEPRMALEAALQHFTANLIVEMLPVGKLLRDTLPE